MYAQARFWLNRPDLQVLDLFQVRLLETQSHLQQLLKLTLPALAAQTYSRAARLAAISALTLSMPATQVPVHPQILIIPELLSQSAVQKVHTLHMLLAACFVPLLMLVLWSRRWATSQLAIMLPEQRYSSMGAHPRLRPWSGVPFRSRRLMQANRHQVTSVDLLEARAFMQAGGSILEITVSEEVPIEQLLAALHRTMLPTDSFDMLLKQVEISHRRLQVVQAADRGEA